MFGSARDEPGRHSLDIGLGDRTVVFEPQQVFEHHLHRVGQARHAGQAVLFGFDDRVVGVGLAADHQGRFGLEAVYRGHCCSARHLVLRQAPRSGKISQKPLNSAALPGMTPIYRRL